MRKKQRAWIAFVLATVAVFFACAPAAFAVVGDIDGNGKMQSADSRAVLRYSARLCTLTDAQLAKADLNYDGRVNTADARLLLRASSRLISLECFDRYYMQAKFTNSSTGTVTMLDTAWMDDKVLIKLNDTTMMIYDNNGFVSMIDHTKKQYSVMSFDVFQEQYPRNAAYFANGAKELCWSKDLPTPLYLEDQGFSKSVLRDNGSVRYVYTKNFKNGYQTYTFDSNYLPLKSEFYADRTLMTLEFLSFYKDPTYLFTQYLQYKKV